MCEGSGGKGFGGSGVGSGGGAGLASSIGFGSSITGGGPAGASEIWITHVYQLAFGRIRFGLASAYSVILFVVMMAMGWFYVRALTRGEDRSPG